MDGICSRICQLPHSLIGSSSSSREPPEGFRIDNSVEVLTPLRAREQLYESNLTKYLLSNTEYDREQGFSEVGSMCDICDTNASTHYAIPCYHAACKVCWSRWLANQNKCMVCCTQVQHLSRYPIDMLPAQLFEISEHTKNEQRGSDVMVCILVVEEGVERATRSILQVKETLECITEGLQTIESHLIHIMRPDPGMRLSMETLTSVLAVEQVSVVEQFQIYEDLFASSQEWEAMDTEIRSLCIIMANLEPLANESNVLAVLKVLREITSDTGIHAQWLRVRVLLENCGPNSHLVPNIAKPFGLIDFARLAGVDSSSSVDIPMRANRIMVKAQSKASLTETILKRDLLGVAENIISKLESK